MVVATIQIEFEVPAGVDAEAWAADAVGAMFTDNLQMSGVINNWCYLKVGNQYMYATAGTLDNED